jgi:hypothetical protein
MAQIGLEFTVEDYGNLLDKALVRYRFVTYTDSGREDGRALWRHDIDFSPHRAVAMAEQEAARGVRATYFIQLTSPYYNVLESGVLARLRCIADLGHSIGIHFEPVGEASEEQLAFEAKTLSRGLNVPIRVFSLHNPTTYDATRFEADCVAGLINASAPVWRKDFTYCSDSNGMWRFRPLAEVLNDPASRNVHVLTHPEWWQEEAMPPRERIRRCIAGRAEYCTRYYDELLDRHGRVNLGKDSNT